jgi:MFS family permease
MQRRPVYYTDSVIEQSTVRKLFRHLLPPFCMVAASSTLVALNLGYAGPVMTPALSLTATQLGFANALFCVGYLAASLAAAWCLSRFGARYWVTGMVVTAGVLAGLQALVGSPTSLYIVRLLLGVAMANLPGVMAFQLTRWLPKRHCGGAIATLIATAALAPALGGGVSRLLVLAADWVGVSGWQSLFVVEALPLLWPAHADEAAVGPNRGKLAVTLRTPVAARATGRGSHPGHDDTVCRWAALCDAMEARCRRGDRCAGGRQPWHGAAIGDAA